MIEVSGAKGRKIVRNLQRNVRFWCLRRCAMDVGMREPAQTGRAVARGVAGPCASNMFVYTGHVVRGSPP